MTAKEEYINNRLHKAATSLTAAEILCANNIHEEAVSKLYYAMFKVTRKLSPKTHSGVKNLFHKEFVLSGELSIEVGKLYDFLLMKRFETDYEEYPIIGKEEVEKYLGGVKSL